jgi:alkylation response protein AidB-like acyl-CoA dehydrogenase
MGSVAFVPDLEGAGLLVAVAVGPDAAPVAVALAADAPGVRIEPVRSYDFTRRLAPVQFSGARGQRLDVGLEALGDAWYLALALIAAESIGATQTCLDRSVAYAK